ncbi:MAG: RNA degradosome polyphosphate kinase, partial [Candidatus Dormibacteraeota bacterium]|nr:RNA degradosome polyphosphate kinase [Candidatus Dormibacteraeota bacterium]
MASSPPRVRSTPAGSAEAARVASAERAAGERYLNRELSLLDYNARVLARAEDASLPLLERVRNLHFFARATDDFFQIRVAGLKEQLDAAPSLLSLDGRTPAEQLREIRNRVDQLMERQSRLWRDALMPALSKNGIKVVDAQPLSKRDLDHLAEYYRSRIFPVLTPLAVDPAHPFPYISHFSLNLAVIVRDP